MTGCGVALVGLDNTFLYVAVLLERFAMLAMQCRRNERVCGQLQKLEVDVVRYGNWGHV